MALADLGRTAEGDQALQRATATQLDRENPDAWRALGALLFDAGDARAGS